jgi:hypothetical protein
MAQFGDFIIYVDESGDHSMAAKNPEYPVFVLAFCIFRVSGYVSVTVPAVQSLKFAYFGHDMIVLHEREIRKGLSPFNFPLEKERRTDFLASLNRLMAASDFTIIASVIKKEDRENSKTSLRNLYNVALECGLTSVLAFLSRHAQQGLQTSIVFESRGKKEDAELREEFSRLKGRKLAPEMHDSVDFIFASKQANSAGLQIADLIARPIGIHVLNPHQSNRAWEILRTKMRTSPSGRILDWGLIIAPHKTKNPR